MSTTQLACLVMISAVLLILTPACLCKMSGAETEEDMQQWLMSQPLEKIIRMQAMTRTGIALIPLAAMLLLLG